MWGGGLLSITKSHLLFNTATAPSKKEDDVANNNVRLTRHLIYCNNALFFLQDLSITHTRRITADEVRCRL